MASTDETMSEIRIQHVRTKYHWPAIQLNFWMLIILIASCVEVGIFAYFVTVQHQLQVGIPWYFTYWVTVGTIGIHQILLMLWLISQRRLLPGMVMLGSFISFVLWMVGLIVVSVELWGPDGSISSDCNIYVSDMEFRGPNIATLAWLEQDSICQSWKAVWSFELVGVIFFLWMFFLAYRVYQDDNY